MVLASGFLMRGLKIGDVETKDAGWISHRETVTGTPNRLTEPSRSFSVRATGLSESVDPRCIASKELRLFGLTQRAGELPRRVEPPPIVGGE